MTFCRRVRTSRSHRLASPPRGALEIPSLKLAVPIFAGTSELELNRGVGWIQGAAMPGEDGNQDLRGRSLLLAQRHAG